MSHTRAVVFHKSYATGTETLRVTTLSPATSFVKAPTSIASLSRLSENRAFPKFAVVRECFASLIIPSFFRSMFEKHSKRMKGFGEKLLKPGKSWNLIFWIPGLESHGIFVQVMESHGI